MYEVRRSQSLQKSAIASLLIKTAMPCPQYGSVKARDAINRRLYKVTDYCKDGDLSRLCDLGRVIKKPYPNRIGPAPVSKDSPLLALLLNGIERSLKATKRLRTKQG